MRELWDRYLWIVALVTLTSVLLVAIYGREPFCTADLTQHCLREWVSATSGWFAVFAAFVTILYLAHQIEQTTAQHEETLRANALPAIALAKRFSATAYGIQLAYEQLQDAVKNRARYAGDLQREVQAYCARLDVLRTTLDNPDLKEFDRMFLGDWVGVHGILTCIDSLVIDAEETQTQIEGAPNGSESQERLAGLRSLLEQLTPIETYCSAGRNAASEFLKDWK